MLNASKHLENTIPDYKHYFKGVKNTKGIEIKIESNGVLDDISTENK